MSSKKSQRAKIVDVGPSESGWVSSTRENRDLPAREKIEETLINLATALGRKTVHRTTIRDGTTMYSVDGSIYQRGANVILELSRKIADQARD